MASTSVLAILLVGLILTRPTPSNTESTASLGLEAGAQQQQRGVGGRGGQSIASFFDASGAVDYEAVEATTGRFSQGGGPAGTDSGQFFDRFSQQIDDAVISGEITQAQADALKAAFAQAESGEI